MYLILQYLEEPYCLKIQDIVRFGRMAFRVISIGNNAANIQGADEVTEFSELKNVLTTEEQVLLATREVGEDIKCRYCYDNEVSEANPLL